ncbi:MAG: hydroxymethylbilane synthase [Rhodospirillales bacterium]|nr:hydroxymethylbilane synthase [Rhodospirillales bacterium]
MADTRRFRIGTRGSPLALAQTGLVALRLKAAHPALAEPGALETVVIKTTGDKVLDRPLADIGGKGLFSKEIDEALKAGRIDLAVHSVKDMETWLADGIVLAAVLEREDPRDVFISAKAKGLADLPPGGVVATASLRRQAQVLHRRPDLRVQPLRGNVETRLRKLKDGAADAILLALAGLKRLGLADEATAILAADEILPAVGQGAIGVTCRAGDERARELLAAIGHGPSMACVTAERAMLAALDGSCRTPIAGLAEVDRNGDDGGLTLRGLVARPDGSKLLQTSRAGSVADAEKIGRDAGLELKRRAGPGFFD